MSGLDYQSLVALGREENLRGAYFRLELGPWELEAMPYSTIETLAGDPALVHEILGRCFLSRPLLWSNLESESAGHCGMALGDLASLLDELDRRLAAEPASRNLVLREIIDRWCEATSEAIRRLEESVGGSSPETRDDASRALISEYRRKAYAPISALLQLLPEDDEWAEEARERFAAGKSALAAGVEPPHEASWHRTEAVEKDSARSESEAITWGIP